MTSPRDRLMAVPTFRSLRHRNYRLFFSGQIISTVGTWMQTMAQSWLVYQLTHSSVWLGILGFLTTIPMLFFVMYGGAVADRFSRHRILIVTQTLSLVQSVILTLLVAFNGATVELVCLMAFTLGTINAFDVPARQSFVVGLVEKQDLANAIALNSASFNAARIVGPAIGGVVIAAFGVGWCFFLNAISFFAVIIVLLRLKIERRAPTSSRTPGFLSSVRESAAYVRSDRTLVSILTLVAVITMFGWSYTVLLPIFADTVLGIGAVGLGNLMMSFGIGALISAITVASTESRVPPTRFIFGGITLFVLGISVFAISTNVVTSVYSLIFVGMGLIMFISTANAAVQRRAPDALRGRVMGFYLLIFQGLAPFGHLGMGWLAGHIGVRWAVLSGASVCALAAVGVRMTFSTQPPSIEG